MNDEYSGIKIVGCPGMPEDTIMAVSPVIRIGVDEQSMRDFIKGVKLMVSRRIDARLPDINIKDSDHHVAQLKRGISQSLYDFMNNP